jgi:hypothetical protein
MTLQMYKYHKVDLMVLPVTSMIKEMFEILREYEADGLVRLKPSAVIPNIVSIKIVMQRIRIILKMFSPI